jgi:tRNA dimethylallyltransferase
MRYQLIAIVGPTASGKTDLAIDLARHLGTEIVSADSMQFYRGLEIGTAQPTVVQLARVPHLFIGNLDPSVEISAADYADAARAHVARLNALGKPAVVVGGSGLYIRALIDGLFEGPAADPDIRARLHERAEAGETPQLYAELQGVDPDYAARIQPGDLRRIVRALEVFELTGRPLSALHAEHRQLADPLNALQIGLDWRRDRLYDRINRRVQAMFDAGLLDEVRQLLDAGHEPDLERLRPLGYRECIQHLRGELSLPDTIAAIKQATRRFAKRQLTWFRADERIHWIPPDPDATPPFRVEQVTELLG